MEANKFNDLLHESTPEQLEEIYNNIFIERINKAAQIVLHSSCIPCLLLHIHEGNNVDELDNLIETMFNFQSEYRTCGSQLKSIKYQLDYLSDKV